MFRPILNQTAIAALGVAFLAGVAAVSNAASASNAPAVGTAATASIGNTTASQDRDSAQESINATLSDAEAKKAEALKQADKAREDALKKAEELEKKADKTKAEALKKAQAALEQARQILEQVKNAPAPISPASEQPSQPSTSVPVPAPATPPTISATFSQTGSIIGAVNITVSAPGVTQLELDGQRNGSLIQKYITVLDGAGDGTFTGSWDTTQTPNGSIAISAAFSFSGGRASQALGSFTINNPIVQSPVLSVEQVIPQQPEKTAAPTSNVIQDAITSLQNVQQQLKTVTEAPPAASPAPTPETKPAPAPRMPEPAKESNQSKQSEPEQTRPPVTTGQLRPPQPPEVIKTPTPAPEQKPLTPAPEQPSAYQPAPPAAPSVSPTTSAPPSQVNEPLSPTPSVASPTQTPPASTPAVQPSVPVQPTLPRPAAALPETKPEAQSEAKQAVSPPASSVNLSSTDPRFGGIPVPAVLKVEAVTLVTPPNQPIKQSAAPAKPTPLPAPKPAPQPQPQPQPQPPKPPTLPPGEKLVLAGRAIPNAFITLYIYSEPIVIDVRADASGRWEYTLDRRVSDGPHEAYVAITDTTGRVIVKSSPFRFVKVAQAVSVVTAAPTPETILAPDSNFSARQFTMFMALAVFGAVLLGFVIIAAVAKTKQR